MWGQSDGSNNRIYAASYFNTHAVSPSAGAGGSIAPSTAQTVNDGETTQFIVTPDAGYTASVGGTCGGTLVDDTYTTNAITEDCSAVATFASAHEDDTATGSGTATATTTVSGNSDTACAVSSAGLVSVVAAPPQGVTLPHGMYAFTVESCTPGFSAHVTIEYPDPIPAGAEYWKYDAGGVGWYPLPATISGNQVSFTVTDGGMGDHTGVQNGTITDPGGIGITSSDTGGATPIPALSQWAMILLSLLLGGMAFVTMRRRV